MRKNPADGTSIFAGDAAFCPVAGNAGSGVSFPSWSHPGMNTAAQSWTAYSDGSLRALGKCLSLTGAGAANGTGVDIDDCTDTSSQQWLRYDGAYRNPVSGRCLNDPAASATNGTSLQLYDWTGTLAQVWTAPGVTATAGASGPIRSSLAAKAPTSRQPTPPLARR